MEITHVPQWVNGLTKYNMQGNGIQSAKGIKFLHVTTLMNLDAIMLSEINPSVPAKFYEIPPT